jgi:hypothetical protein
MREKGSRDCRLAGRRKLANHDRIRYDQKFISTRIMRIRLRTAREGLQSPSLSRLNYEHRHCDPGLLILG